MLEKDVQKQIIDFLSLRGWRFYRTHFAHIPGANSAGELGAPDGIVTRYMPTPEVPARCMTWWLEFKGPRDQRTCQCKLDKKGKTVLCKVCRQKKWHERERQRGALVIQTSSLDAFAAWYDVQFGWLHRDNPIPHKPQASLFEELT